MKIGEFYTGILPHEFNDELSRLASLLDEAQKDLDHWTREWAVLENEYRKKKAKVYLASSGTVDYRKALVDEECSDERIAAHMAEGLKAAALENVRNRRAQLNACQTRCNNIKTELEIESAQVRIAWSEGRQ